MPKQLLDPHFIAVVLFMVIIGVGWMLNRVPTETALPLLGMAAGIGFGGSAIRQGISIGVPLAAAQPETKVQP